jgi:ABC-type transporter MlaC component
MSLGEKNTTKGVGEQQKENFLKAYKEYLNQKKNG